MSLNGILKKYPKRHENGSFAEFFRNATPKEKIRVFTKAAELANKDQRKLVEEVGNR